MVALVKPQFEAGPGAGGEGWRGARRRGSRRGGDAGAALRRVAGAPSARNARFAGPRARREPREFCSWRAAPRVFGPGCPDRGRLAIGGPVGSSPTRTRTAGQGRKNRGKMELRMSGETSTSALARPPPSADRRDAHRRPHGDAAGHHPGRHLLPGAGADPQDRGGKGQPGPPHRSLLGGAGRLPELHRGGGDGHPRAGGLPPHPPRPLQVPRAPALAADPRGDLHRGRAGGPADGGRQAGHRPAGGEDHPGRSP